MGIPSAIQAKRTFVPVGNEFDSGNPDGEVTPPPIPDAPAAPNVTAGNTQLSASWSAVANATSYDVIYNTSDSTSGATAFSGNPVSGTSAVITGLTNGTTYYVFVRASNSVGDSAYSASGSGAPVSDGIVRTTLVVTGKEMLAPNIIARRTLQGTPGTFLSQTPPDGEIGTLETYNYVTWGMFAEVNGDIGMLGCENTDKNYSPVMVRTPEIVKRFRIMRSECVPEGAIMPGFKSGMVTIGTEVFPNESGMKSCWPQFEKGSSSVSEEPDCAIGQNTYGNLGVLGNAINFGETTRYFSAGGAWPYPSSDGHWDWDGWNHISYWQDCDEDNPQTEYAPIQLMFCNAKTNAYKTVETQIQNLSRRVFRPAGTNVIPPENMGYKIFPVNAFTRTGVEGRQLATKDYYVAVQSAAGVEDYKQVAYLANLTNTADITTQTGWKTMIPAVWTAAAGDTTVSVDTTSAERAKYNCLVVWHDNGTDYTIAELAE